MGAAGDQHSRHINGVLVHLGVQLWLEGEPANVVWIQLQHAAVVEALADLEELQHAPLMIEGGVVWRPQGRTLATADFPTGSLQLLSLAQQQHPSVDGCYIRSTEVGGIMRGLLWCERSLAVTAVRCHDIVGSMA
jgi:hypothetical protein